MCLCMCAWICICVFLSTGRGRDDFEDMGSVASRGLYLSFYILYS